ncbi:MAG: electron transfer flavoprotein beta subunit/FixA family protein [Propionibacteriaceae bacterium]|jgi:electron transfer flavoprotein beta subunit|nr:electron transfer flavoprotein beta subunit/FixA family protein [Propionibacteriaceae bacterium]
MKIVVAYAWAPDPQEASVGADGQVDFSRAKPVVSEYDAVAIEVGRQLATATSSALVGISVGGPATGTPVATKAALSRGLDEVMVASDAALADAGTTRTAQGLAAMVQRLGDVSVVLTGDSSVDSGSRMMPPVLAGLLGWPVLSDVQKVSVTADGVTVERLLREGVQQVSVTGPVVLALASDATQPKAPGMKDVLAAGKKPVTKLEVADLGPAVAEGTVVSTAKLTGPARKGIVINTADPAAAAAELVGALRAAGVIGSTGGQA